MKHLLLFLATLPAAAQINSISTNGNGDQFWFASGFVLRGEAAATFSGRIYSYKPDAIHVETQSDQFSLQLYDPFLSADGKTTGWHNYNQCFGSCMFAIPRAGLVLNRNGRDIKFSSHNTLNLSRNGRWLYEAGFPNFLYSTMTDLDTDSEVPGAGIFPVHPRHAVSDAGVVLGVPPHPVFRGIPGDDHQLQLWQVGSDPKTIYQGDQVRSAGISADGSTLVVATDTQLLRIDPSTGAQQLLLASDKAVTFSMNTTGTRVAVMRGNEIVLLDSGADPRTLYTSPEPLKSMVLTDDGSTVFAVSELNRTTRIDVVSGSASEVFPPTFGAPGSLNYGVPGSVLRYLATGVTTDEIFTVDGVRFPIVKIAGNEFQVQVPWDYVGQGQQTFSFVSPGSPFEAHGSVYIDNVLKPAFANIPYNADIVAAQQDFSATVTQDNPAPAGSTVHIWLTGLGALDRPVKTGEPGPTDPPAHPLTPFACYISTSSGPAVGARLPFIAYAPGLIGLYQVDLTIPENWPAGKQGILCTVDNRLGTYGTIWTR